MNEIMNTIVFCIGLGTVIVCIALIVTGIWRWFGGADRLRRLNFSGIIAVPVLSVMYLFRRRRDLVELFSDSKTNASLTSLVINISKIVVKLLMLGAVIASVLLLLVMVFLFMRYVISIIGKAKPGNKKVLVQDLQDMSQELLEIMRTHILILAVTCGILAVYAVMPLLMGESQKDSLSEAWQDGVRKIADFAGSNSQEYAFLTYTLLFIIILGVGCAVIQILYSIIKNIFARRNRNDIIEEYSSSMGILAVGVSILWTIQKKDVNIFAPDSNTVVEFAKSFGTILIIMAVGILTLELIRLLVDMSEKLIRIEGKYLFIFLVGQASILLLSMLNSIYGAANMIVGNKAGSAPDQMEDKIRDAMIKAVEEQTDGQKNHKRTFSGFTGKSTKK